MPSEALSQKLIKLRSKLFVLLDAEEQLRQETEMKLREAEVMIDPREQFSGSNVVQVDFLKNLLLSEKLKIRSERMGELLLQEQVLQRETEAVLHRVVGQSTDWDD